EAPPEQAALPRRTRADRTTEQGSGMPGTGPRSRVTRRGRVLARWYILRAMSEVVLLGGPGAMVGIVTGFVVRRWLLLGMALIGLALVAAIGVYGTTTPGETAAGWLAGILAAAQYMAFLAGMVVG